MPATGVIKVIDASALAAIVFDEPAADEVTERIRDCKLVAPSLLGYEMANVCWVKLRRRPDQRESLLAALQVPGLAPETLEIDHNEVVDLAIRASLTTYDASYLWLAVDLGVELVTLDRRLAAAAEKFQ
jgi:predicted nucleic acid-binding protein